MATATGIPPSEPLRVVSGVLKSGCASSQDLAKLFETTFARYPKAAAIGFATIPARDEGGLSIAALNRMILGAVRGLQARRK